jgi:hypothetical protein
MSSETRVGRYVIKSMQQTSGGWAARAFRGQKTIVDVRGEETQQAAITAVKLKLDAIRSRRRGLRGSDGYPNSDEVREALEAMSPAITKPQWDMLDAHLAAHDHILTATEIALAGGYANYGAANIQYGQLGRTLAEELEWEPPIVDGVRTWTSALATGTGQDGSAGPDPSAKGHWRWKLRKEIVEALQSGHSHNSVRP